MKLNEFVSNTLTEIVEGVKLSQKSVGNAGQINPSFKGNSSDYNRKEGVFIAGTPDGDTKVAIFVNFDVAVSAIDGKDSKGGISVVSGLINLGTHGASSESNSTTSRIRFQVPVVLP